MTSKWAWLSATIPQYKKSAHRSVIPQSSPQALMDEILMLQEEISELQSALADELVSESPESEPAEQLALHSTLTVLAERMSTIKMKASGKRQLLEVTGHPWAAPHIQINCLGLGWQVCPATYVIDMFIVCHSKEAGILCVQGLVNRALSQCGAMNVSFHQFLIHFRPAELRQRRANTG